jgi:hypothetical protein
MPDGTRLPDVAAAGDRKTTADLLPPVYDELRGLAVARMASESPGQTLDATALVHEAYRRLVGDQRADGRGHFFATEGRGGRLQRRPHMKTGGALLPRREREDFRKLVAAVEAMAEKLPETAPPPHEKK